MGRTKKIKQAGRFRVGFGKKVISKFIEIESRQRKKQVCNLCGGALKRLSKGIWQCKRCNKKMASGTFIYE